MSKDNKENTEDKYHITITDWIVFLESKSSSNVSIYLGILSAFVILFISLSNTIENIYLLISLIGVVYVLYFLIEKRVGKRIKPIQDLSEDIILGNITDSKEIKQKYEDYLKTHKKRLI